MKLPTDNVDFRKKLTGEFPGAAWALKAEPEPIGVTQRFTMVNQAGLPIEVMRTGVMTMRLSCTVLRQMKPHPTSSTGHGDFNVAQANSNRRAAFKFHFVGDAEGNPIMEGLYLPVKREELTDIVREAAEGSLLLDPAVAANYIASLFRGEYQAAIETGQRLFADQNGIAVITFDDL